MAEFAVILVYTTTDAIFAERVLRRADLAAKLIPTPRHLGSDCGSAVRIPASESERCEELLRTAGVSLSRIVPLNT
ncbi:MAG: DUF3343 domain-containing protein [Phycisphaerales bacterium]|nr:MAG: DUF3343 domain-containing protein [Phycisphaerales bacterium]